MVMVAILYFCLNLFGDNRSLRFSVRSTSVGALFYFANYRVVHCNILKLTFVGADIIRPC